MFRPLPDQESWAYGGVSSPRQTILAWRVEMTYLSLLTACFLKKLAFFDESVIFQSILA